MPFPGRDGPPTGPPEGVVDEGPRLPGRPTPPGAPGAGGKEDPRNQGPRINERIRVREVRLIDDEGNQVGVVPTEKALEMAREKDLDLVEVAPEARPPVCKILDFGKFKYSQKKKVQESKSKQHKVLTKELRLRPKTGPHDFDTKIGHARRFFDKQYKVQVNVLFRGRERAHAFELGKKLCDKFAKDLEDVAKVEMPARLEGFRMVMILAKK